jgi:glyoxalase family protein
VPRGDLGAGSVHHIAFAVENKATQLEVRKALLDTGYQLTPVIDRDYFFSVYFRTPGGVLFEIATNEPGFDRDEDSADLGEGLMLPQQHKHLRPILAEHLQNPNPERMAERLQLLRLVEYQSVQHCPGKHFYI